MGDLLAGLDLHLLVLRPGLGQPADIVVYAAERYNPQRPWSFHFKSCFLIPAYLVSEKNWKEEHIVDDDAVVDFPYFFKVE